MNKKRTNIAGLFWIICLLVVCSCNEDEKDLTDQFHGKWTVEEVLLNDLTNDIQILTNEYERCVIDDILDFEINQQLKVNEGVEICADVTYPYSYQLELTIDSDEKIVGFQILPVFDQVYHSLFPTSDYFFVESANAGTMEISNLTRCENQQICRRVIKLKRL